jgi:hypothetical protein
LNPWNERNVRPIACTIERLVLACLSIAILFPPLWFLLAAVAVVSGMPTEDWVTSDWPLIAVFIAFWGSPLLLVAGLGWSLFRSDCRRFAIWYGLLLLGWLSFFGVLHVARANQSL